VLGFSHIAWALSQVTKGGGRAKFVWGKEKKHALKDMKHHLFSSPVLSLPDLQKPFEIETDATDYTMGAVLTQHGHLVAYHSETLFYTIWKYSTYDKVMQTYRSSG
jgi:hypothetical protein